MRPFVKGTYFALCLACIGGPQGFAMDTVYQRPAEFLGEYLPGCGNAAIWLNADVQSEIERLIGHPYRGVRVQYCRQGDRTGWILDEIGKTEPITTGIVVDRGKVERVRVLVFRESRGSEVRRGAFVRQYENATLSEGNTLDRSIDGITGATLSVHALSRQVKLALLLDRAVRKDSDDD